LLARIEEKKAELGNLKELRDLSASVARQMEALEQKLGTLSDGTEGKAFEVLRFARAALTNDQLQKLSLL
jgi:hypothetical protein